MKRFRCGDVVPGCDAVFEGTESEILERVADHAHDDHGLTDLPPEVVEGVRSHLEPT